MAYKQTCIRFEHPCGVLTSSQWRQRLMPTHSSLLEDVAVFQSSSALSFTAKTPDASERMRQDALGLMKAVAAIASRMLSVEMPEFTPGISFTGYRWLYEIPCLVVARAGENWDGWSEPDLCGELQEKTCGRISSDLTKQFDAWGLAGKDLAIELVHPGVPMPLKNVVAHGPKPTSAMARKKVIFSSAARIEGAFWVGLLQATGHGRIYRGGYQHDAKQQN